jgi:methionyl-tRNA formyltransferase
MKLNMSQLKDLAKSKNIPLFQGKNIKKKNILVQDIMDSN